MIGRVFCLVGSHDYRWVNPNVGPPLWWRECRRCEHVPTAHRLEYNVYCRLKEDG